MLSKTELGLVFLPLGIMLMCAAALWQLYVMLNETHTLNRFGGRKLLAVVTVLFFTFSSGVYFFCPNARRKGLVFLLLGGGGLTLFLLARSWLPFAK